MRLLRCKIDGKDCDSHEDGNEYSCHVEMMWFIAPCCCDYYIPKHAHICTCLSIDEECEQVR